VKFSDVNRNGILDSHEKWFLLLKIVTVVWSLGFLTASYVSNLKVDRPALYAIAGAAGASLGTKKSDK